MPTFEMVAPDGKKYRIDAPDGQSALSALDGIAGASAPQERQKSPAIGGKWGVMDEALSMILGDLPKKGNAAIGSLADSTVDAVQGEGFNYSDNYNRHLESQRQAQTEYNTDHPIMSGIGKGAGLALGVTNMPVWGKGALGAAGTGAAYGGVMGLGQDAESIPERAYNTGLGAITGGAIGTAGYGLGKAAGWGANKLSRAWETVNASPQDKAAIQMRSLFDDAGGAPAVQQQLDNLGPDAMNVDVLGERGRSIARTSSNIEPSARETLEASIFGRKATQNQRIVADIERAAGLPAGSRETVDSLKRKAYEEIAPEINRAYAQAREAGYDLPLSAIDDILGTPMGKQARLDALKAVQNRYYKETPRVPVLNDGPAPTPKDRTIGIANRMVRKLGPVVGPRPQKPTDLVDFVKSKGGLQDFKGELRSIDAKSVRGLVRENGISMDQARELAAREGFLDYKFGNADRAVAESTVADFIDAIDNNVRGNPVFATGDTWAADNWHGYKDAQASRASIYEAAKRIADESGGSSVNDDIMRDAIEGVIQRGEDPADALARARYADHLNYGTPPQEVPAGIFEKNLRNYSNLSLADEMKRSLDDVARSSNRAGRANEASQASGMAKDLRTRIDDLLGDDIYATARGLRQKAYKADEAFDIGSELGRGRVPLDLPGRASKVDPEFRPNVSKAYAATKAETLLNRNGTEGALNELSTPIGRESLTAALGDKSSAVVKALEREKLFNRTARAVTGNSTTARQLAEMGGVGVGTAATAAAMGYDMTTGGVAGIMAALMRKGGPALAKKMSTDAQRKAAPIIAEMLTSRGIPAGVQTPGPALLERFSSADRAKMEKLFLMLLREPAQNTNRQMNPARK